MAPTVQSGAFLIPRLASQPSASTGTVTALCRRDFWAVGHNAYGPGEGSLGIGCHNTNLCLSISPSGTVNIPYALQIGGTSTNTMYMARPWVQCIVNQTASILAGSDTGRTPPTIARTSGQAAGAYDITFSSHPRSFNYTYCVQPRVDAGLAFAVVSNVLANSLKVRTYNASQALTDVQFSITIFS